MGKNKYHAKKTIVDGITFDSKIESEYYLYLKDSKEKGIVTDFKMQTVYVLQDKYIKVDGQVITGNDPNFDKIKRKTKAKTISAITYKSDFDVTYKDGRKEVIDIKGNILTETFKIKRKLLEFKYPELVFKVITKLKDEWIDFEEYKKIKAAKRKNSKQSKIKKKK